MRGYAGAPDLDLGGQTDHQHYLRSDGRLVPLVAQSLDDPRCFPKTSEWTRMGRPPSQVPSILRVAYWVGSSTTEDGSDNRVYSVTSLSVTLAKLVGASPLMYLLLSGFEWSWFLPFQRQGARARDVPEPCYDAVFCFHGNHARINAAPLDLDENAPAQTPSYVSNIRLDSNIEPPRQAGVDLSGPWISRTGSTALSLRPRYLCFVKDFDKGTYETAQVSDYIARHGEQADTEFVFVSYTRVQFRVATDSEIDAYNYPHEQAREANRKIARQDRETLVRWGMDAARAAGKRAFWLDFECVRDEDGVARASSSSEDVYHICDIVRAAHSMIIAIGPSVNDRLERLQSREPLPSHTPDSATSWLHQWGSRLWTLPELLLSPSEYRIKLYISGDAGEPRALAKRNFAERAWADAETVKDLVNHYEASAILTPLQLIDTALECFSRRKTDQFSPGDIAYAIMGLLPDRQRPKVNREDSGFQAFARLSLAHDDGRFLERLICLLPPRKGAQWYETDDLWGAKLKDILPTCQLAQVADSDVIVLDGAFGAMISWGGIDSTGCLDLFNKAAASIFLGGLVFSVLLPKFWVWVLLMIFWQGLKVVDERDGARLLWLTCAVLAIPLLSPILITMAVLWRRHGPRKLTHAKLIGIEGFADTATVERYLWGINSGRLRQTSNIPLFYNEDDEPLRPESRPEHAFTLIDTNALTITHFHAKRPPVAMFICGHESRMQRALLCSYDWKSNTYCRETVLRVSNQVFDRMKRVDRFRFALEFPSQAEEDLEGPRLSLYDDAEANAAANQDACDKILDDGLHSWRLTGSFILIILVSLGVRGFYNTYMGKSAMSYHGGFLAAQVLAHLLLRHGSMVRVVYNLVILKGFVFCFQGLLPLRIFGSSLYSRILYPLDGAVDGLLLPMFVVFVWSWFPANQAPARMLAWVSFGVVVYRPFGRIVQGLSFFPDDSILYALLCFSFAVGGSHIGVPMEVPWLEAHKKVLFARRAATHKYSQEDGQSVWSQDSVMKSPQPWLFSTVSLLNALVAEKSPSMALHITTNELWTLLGGSITGLLLVSKAPRTAPAVTILCILLSIAGSTIHRLVPSSREPGVLVALVRLQAFVLPLLWALIVRCTTTRSEGLWALSMSLMGLTAGRMVGLELGVGLSITLSLLQVALVGLIWLWEYRREAKAVGAVRSRFIEEEYHDDADGS